MRIETEQHPSGLRTMANEHPETLMRMENTVPLPRCCPVSHNPQPGSTLSIRYRVGARVLEVYALKQYIQSYVDGHPDGTRNMEAMIQRIAQDCAAALGVPVFLHAHLFLLPKQEMRLSVTCKPDGLPIRHAQGRLVGAAIGDSSLPLAPEPGPAQVAAASEDPLGAG